MSLPRAHPYEQVCICGHLYGDHWAETWGKPRSACAVHTCECQRFESDLELFRGNMMGRGRLDLVELLGGLAWLVACGLVIWWAWL